MEWKEICKTVWVSAVLLYMDSLGYSVFCGVCTASITLVALEVICTKIFTNFLPNIMILSCIMIHATLLCMSPSILNHWNGTEIIGGYDFSGIVEHVDWWSPTIITSHDREAVHIPIHKFTDNVVRNNPTPKSHWHIKSYIAINPLDVNKLTSILADMRKVLAKNPQVEQQKLHRRVFLEDINPENQALKILISCFLKTSHYEEYLCAKEAILLDLLRVVSHHQAQLATPIQTVDEPAASDSKSDENFAGTSTSPPCVNSKDKSKSNSDSQSVVSETSATSSQSKQDEEKSLVLSSSVRPPLEENIVLGVALEDSKQTLPNEEWHLI